MELNKLGDETNDTDSDQSPTTKQPKQFDSGEQEISFNGLEIHFTLTTPEQTCNLFMELREKLNDSPKKPGGYLG